ncbi:MAG: hypothetical protein MZV64_17825 [Ignavibacteriales bacterium]|nr:hypothetical protein [Ignavibacteriales bacterium]
MDVAARILFQQVTMQGASPASIPRWNMTSSRRLHRDPDQVIPLRLNQDDSSVIIGDGTLTPEPTATPFYKIGASIAVRAGPILDRNLHVVPDGTVVRFTMSTSDDDREHIEAGGGDNLGRPGARLLRDRQARQGRGPCRE